MVGTNNNININDDANDVVRHGITNNDDDDDDDNNNNKNYYGNIDNRDSNDGGSSKQQATKTATTTTTAAAAATHGSCGMSAGTASLSSPSFLGGSASMLCSRSSWLPCFSDLTGRTYLLLSSSSLLLLLLLACTGASDIQNQHAPTTTPAPAHNQQ